VMFMNTLLGKPPRRSHEIRLRKAEVSFCTGYREIVPY
jgi:hypothetical protein